MSLLLENGTRPNGLEAKTWSAAAPLMLSGYAISPDDMCDLVRYYLTNADIGGPTDPRLKLVNEIRDFEIVDGWMPGEKRLRLGKS